MASCAVVCPKELREAALTIVRRYKEAPQRRLLVAIAGRPGSGKTTIAEILAEEVKKVLRMHSDDPRDHANDAAVAMPMDGYHFYRKTLRAMPNAEEAVARRGAEWTFDPRKLCKDLQAIRLPAATAETTGIPLYDEVRVPAFDHSVGDPEEHAICITGSTAIVIVEGNYLLYRGTPTWAEVSRCFDIHVFLACPAEQCLERICRRHMVSFKLTREGAMLQAGGTDAVNGDLIDTTKENADIVLHSIECKL
ncbi:uncharacterized protein Tco025E_03686 [Trypanosoma conorhini]|uniref:Phosphoribulokinase/uridine kinase domain-containing protein n=1 Tax=Trypanosoma conorhini TaxID=83891 RepID=A0A422PT78_9TRYP|nr:uncharacterized protein Tco025E_03686 [Trypanosoma conorhini]RNF20928.1 hypothetical protein Tco025E_03686 [Trypanosoma conorhini]